MAAAAVIVWLGVLLCTVFLGSTFLRILSVVNPSAVRWLGTAFDGQNCR
jgi:hypothetical protein